MKDCCSLSSVRFSGEGGEVEKRCWLEQCCWLARIEILDGGLGLLVVHETVDDVGSTGAFIGASFGEGREVAGALSASEKLRSLSGGLGSL